jgi:putative membrane protein insertion efficiency factor
VTEAIRSALWTLGVPARLGLVGLIRLYRLLLSGSLGGQCRFYPSCSHYGEEAVRVHGAIKGSLMAAWRIARCGPFTRGGVDPVQPRRRPAASYDGVILRSSS